MRIFFLIPGFLLKLIKLAIDGSRDINNKIRYKKSIIDDGSSFCKNTKLNSNSIVLSNCIFNNVTLGSFSYVGRNSLLQNVTIGKFCSISNNVIIGLGNHPIDKFSTSPIFYKKNNTLKISIVKDLGFKEYEDIIIENDVWIGAGAIIMDGVKIGNGAVVAAGAIVTKNVGDYEIVAGVPAKVIKKRSNKVKNNTNGNGWWNNSLNFIIKNYL